MIALLTSLALAAPPLDPGALADAEVEAKGLIERCRYASCPHDPRALGEAFLVRATAAAVLRGEIDSSAAANARFLAPDLASSWGALLPGSDREEPEAWVRDWADPQPHGASPPPPALLPDRSAREPRREASPLQARADAPTVTRLGLTATPRRGSAEAALGGEVRAQVAPLLGVVVAASLGEGRSPLPEQVAEELGTDVETLRGRTATFRAGAGPRWTSEDGAELGLYAALLGEVSGPTFGTWSALADDNVYIDPATLGVGAGLGAIGVQPLGRAPHLAIAWDAGAEWTKRRMADDYLGSRREAPFEWPDVDRDGVVRDLTRVRAAVDLRWEPGEGVASVYAGVGTEYDRYSARVDPEVPGGSDLFVMPRVGGGWTF